MLKSRKFVFNLLLLLIATTTQIMSIIFNFPVDNGFYGFLTTIGLAYNTSNTACKFAKKNIGDHNE